ncbi:MAG TPA: transposase [Tepidisphaeraceae bacterium]|nr:transposase [Tepidisphaeraceae bacterium]
MPRFKIGSKPGEKRAPQQRETDYLNKDLADFSGYVAVDELYDGPFCVLMLVDGRRGRRLVYTVLKHKPTHADVRPFFARFQGLLEARGLKLRGITTDGSPLYPEPIAEVFGPVAHQVCQFHVLADLTLAVLRAVAQVRKSLTVRLPKLPRGRPKADQIRQVRAKRRQEQHLAELFTHRYLFVQHGLTPAEKMRLQRLSRGHPSLCTLRQIMDQVYRLFDRRCRTETALSKLARLRRRVRRFRQVGKKLQCLFSPNLEKALQSLNDKLLPATSNVVERSNRRYRKMQHSVYRVRTEPQLNHRIALDILREDQAPGRNCTIKTLHRTRQRPGSTL